MADLEADLYGDLYGNDDSGPAADQDDATAASSSALKTEAKSPALGSVAASKSAPAALEPQPIQTYSESGGANDYAQSAQYDMTGIVSGGDYGGAQGDRSVRPSEMKDEGKMFIGGLNWDTTDDGLRNYFSQFGKVDACTIMRDAAGRSRCFAFLTFDDPQSVNKVMVQEHFLDGKVIDPKRAIPRLEHQRATKLFIGGLAGSVTSESMKEYFSQYGTVIDATVMLDRETGRSKGFGFISFEDTDVRHLLGFGNLEIDGKVIDVKLAQPRYQRDNDPDSVYGGQPNPHNRTSGGMSPAGGGGGAAAGSAGGAGGSFDPQALAALYTRMFQMSGGGMGMGGMNPMMMGMGMGGMGGMGMGGMGGMSGGAGGMGGAAGGMGRGGGGMGRGGMGMGRGGNIPKGPRAAMGGGGEGGGANANGGVQRSARGGHGYHPYAR